MTAPHDGHRASHSKYRLTCDEYNGLVLRSEGRCDLCDKPYPGLVIDHDHALGTWAVRGLLCYSCNANLGIHELPGSRVGPNAKTARYLASPFRLLEPGPACRISIGPELWDRLGEAVGERRRSAVVSDLIRRHLDGEPMPERPGRN